MKENSKEDSAPESDQSQPALGVKKSPVGLAVAAILFLVWTAYLIYLAIRLG